MVRLKVSPIFWFLVFFFLLFPSRVLAIFSPCFDDFSQNRNCLWQPLELEHDFWQITNAALVGNSHYFTTESLIFYLTGDLDWTDYSIEADVKNTEGVDKTIIGRFSDKDHYYILNLRSSFQNQGNDLILGKICCSGHRKELARVPYPNFVDTWYHLRLTFKDREIRAYVNDQLLIDFVDDFYPELPHLTGKAGLMTWGGNYGGVLPHTTAIFDNVRVKKEDPDEIYILIPGLGASWNTNALLSCDIRPFADWTIAPYSGLYNRLNDTFLENAGLKLNESYYVYAYDWRQPMTKQGVMFKTYLDKIMKSKSSETKINIISHSLGGLVIRSYLDQYPDSYKFSKILSLGTPHFGTPLVYPMWEAGEINSDDAFIKLAANFVLNNCKKNSSSNSAVETIRQLVPSLKDLLPVFPYLVNENNDYLPLSSLDLKNDWLLTQSDKNYFSKLTTISGNDRETVSAFKVASSSANEQQKNLWSDGKVTSSITTPKGDGTVLVQSALLPNSLNPQTLPETNHGELIYSDLGIETILKNLGFTEASPAVSKKESVLNITSRPLNLDQLKKNFEWKRYKLKI
ncbi:hypothetical protein HY030_03335 [Candidatus Gottesmanbacteria bacterium]|nr:hypothetical protein [Candidatus Gottesmanbacteria bacterium]